MNYVAIEIQYTETTDFLQAVNNRNQAISQVRPQGYNLCTLDEKASLAQKDGTRIVILVATFEQQ